MNNENNINNRKDILNEKTKVSLLKNNQKVTSTHTHTQTPSPQPTL